MWTFAPLLWVACGPPKNTPTGDTATSPAGDTGPTADTAPTTDTGPDTAASSDTASEPPPATGPFAVLFTADAPAYTHDVGVADLDGDGDDDVVSAANGIGWVENLGGGTFGTYQPIDPNGRGAHLADLDGDGDPDVLDRVGGWYENQGGGAFTPRVVTDYGIGVEAVEAADLDGDGDLDPLYAEYWEPPVYWFPNLGGGGFGQQVVVPTPLGPEVRGLGVAAGDVDGDGDLDVISLTGGDYGAGGLAVSLNEGDGTFGPATLLSGWGASVLAVDIDGDGDVDVLASGQWLENLGDGTFGVGQPVDEDATGNNAAADLDGDGDLDLILGGFDQPVAWYENVGALPWPEHVVTEVLPNLNDVAAADLDRDGCLDLVVGTPGDIFDGIGVAELRWYPDVGCGGP